MSNDLNTVDPECQLLEMWVYLCTEISSCIDLGFFRKFKMISFYFATNKDNNFHWGHSGPTGGNLENKNSFKNTQH